MAKLSTYSFISGLLFWLPILGVLFSGLALIFGIFSLKKLGQEEENKTLAIIGLFLGGIGFIFSSIGVTIMGLLYPSLVLSMQDGGILDTLWPIYSLTLSFSLLVYAILHFTDIDAIKKSIISLCSGFLLSLLLSIPHIFSLYPNAEVDIVNFLNQALPDLTIISLLLIFTLLSTIFINKKNIFYLITGCVIVILFILIKIYYEDVWLLPWLSTLLYSVPLIVVLYQNRDLLKNINKRYYIITAAISLLILLGFIILVLLPLTDAYRNFLYKHSILLVLLRGGIKKIILFLGVTGIIFWSLNLIKIFKNEPLIEQDAGINL
ncbi:MAG: hypothetical protein ACP5OA_00420 [Candidatus Woesearchaeota archaeon]